MIPKSGCRFSEKIMRNNKLKRNDDSTPFRFSMIAAKPRRGQPRGDRQTANKNHDGRACARPSRSMRCYRLQGTRIKSTIDATLVAAVTSRPI
jgi:hypothetical protein